MYGSQNEISEVSPSSIRESKLTDSSQLVKEFKENSKRPYFEDNTYFTIHEEVELLDYDFIEDRFDEPALVLLLNYKNISGTTQVPGRIGLFFSFFQEGQKIQEAQAALSDNFTEQYPEYISGFNQYKAEVKPGEETNFLMTVLLTNTNKVTLEIEEKINTNSEDNILYFVK